MGRNQGSEERGERKWKWWVHKKRRKESQKKGEQDEVWWRVKEEALRQGRAAELCPGTSWSPSP